MRAQRHGFTLVEMLVAMALTLFIMVIVSSAFVTSLETFRQLKALGDMQEGLRTAALRLRTDLGADHFEGRRRLSEPRFLIDGPPREGFVNITQLSLQSTVAGSPYVSEGGDQDGIFSARAVDHELHMTVKLRGNNPQEFFTANLKDVTSPLFTNDTTFFNLPAEARFQTPPGYRSQWAEVKYHMVQSGKTLEPSGTPLYSLFRTQRLLIANNSNVNNLIPIAKQDDYAEMAWLPNVANTLEFLTPDEVTAPARRSIPYAIKAGKTYGQSLLLGNVVSFQVQVFREWDVPNGVANDGKFVDLAPPLPLAAFDSSVPATYRVRALQITLRVWDETTAQARQLTIVQEM